MLSNPTISWDRVASRVWTRVTQDGHYVVITPVGGLQFCAVLCNLNCEAVETSVVHDASTARDVAETWAGYHGGWATTPSDQVTV